MLSPNARARVAIASARAPVHLLDANMEHAATAILELVTARARWHYRGRLAPGLREAAMSNPSGGPASESPRVVPPTTSIPATQQGAEPASDTAA